MLALRGMPASPIAPIAAKVNTHSLTEIRITAAPSRKALPGVIDDRAVIHFGGGASGSSPPSSSRIAVTSNATATTRRTEDTTQPCPPAVLSRLPQCRIIPKTRPCRSRTSTMPLTAAPAVRTRPGAPSRARVITSSTGISAPAMMKGARLAHNDPTSAALAGREHLDVDVIDGSGEPERTAVEVVGGHRRAEIDSDAEGFTGGEGGGNGACHRYRRDLGAVDGECDHGGPHRCR